jgi:hypothetical protein
LTATRDTPLLIGVDGGATEVKACAVVEVDRLLDVGPETASFRHETADFAPVPLDVQLAEREQRAPIQTREERAAAGAWIDAAAQAILSVSARAGRSDVAIGMCMPGLRCNRDRGIDVMKNGPRMPDFLDLLEARLRREGLVLQVGIQGLLSDGVAGALGEEIGQGGNLRHVSNGWYVGGGTGIAECAKIDGRLIALDDLSKTPKAWQMTSSTGETFEDRLSMRGMQAQFRRRSGRDEAIDLHVERAALAGDSAAIATLEDAALALAELATARARTIEGRGPFSTNCIVVGQRLGALLAEPKLAPLFRDVAQAHTKVPLVASRLRAAPALGAAWVARAALLEKQEHARG